MKSELARRRHLETVRGPSGLEPAEEGLNSPMDDFRRTRPIISDRQHPTLKTSVPPLPLSSSCALETRNGETKHDNIHARLSIRAACCSCIKFQPDIVILQGYPMQASPRSLNYWSRYFCIDILQRLSRNTCENTQINSRQEEHDLSYHPSLSCYWPSTHD